MILPFIKYHGAGNDFILLDEREQDYPLNTEIIKHLCDRHFGIGGDGLMRLQADAAHDFRMVYYNADGQESTMCGNGGRCMIAFAKELGIIEASARFIAVDGEHEGSILSGGNIRLKMQDCRFPEKRGNQFFINTGSPHVVCFTDEVSDFPVVQEGRRIRHSPEYQPGGANVNFLSKTKDTWHIRTYERGVEDETLACGTGVTAAALSLAAIDPEITSPLDIQTLGGLLRVYFSRETDSFSEVWLEGPAVKVFSGTIEFSL